MSDTSRYLTCLLPIPGCWETIDELINAVICDLHVRTAFSTTTYLSRASKRRLMPTSVHTNGLSDKFPLLAHFLRLTLTDSGFVIYTNDILFSLVGLRLTSPACHRPFLFSRLRKTSQQRAGTHQYPGWCRISPSQYYSRILPESRACCSHTLQTSCQTPPQCHSFPEP